MSVAGRQLRWGVLGVARIINRLKPALLASKTVKLQAIASRSLDRSREAAREFGFESAYGSYEEMLNDPRVDAVYIPLPNSMHGEWSRKAAEHGKHILCEKPLCPDAAGAADLVAFCRKAGVRIMDGFMWPHHPRTARIRQMIDDGTIGTVHRVNGAFTFKMDPLSTDNIRLQPELGGGSLLDVGCYPVYGIRWAMGAEPARVVAEARTLNGVDIELSGQLQFADGRNAAFDCGFTLPYRGWLEIVGTKGTIRVPRMWLPLPRATWEVELDGEPPVEHAIEGEDQMVHMLDNFAQAVWAGREPVPGPDEAVKTLQVLDALTRSSRERRAVDVSGQ